MAVALAALDAVVHTHERAIPFADFYRLPGDDPSRDTVLEHGELITAVELPPLEARSRYRKARDRASFSFALVSVAAVRADGDARIAFGGVAHRPWRASRAEALLRDGASPAEAADAELAAARPLPGNAFKVPLLRNLLVHTLEELSA
jgi:xanthine dehydrogenase YagS FAD-binding subunit